MHQAQRRAASHLVLSHTVVHSDIERFKMKKAQNLKMTVYIRRIKWEGKAKRSQLSKAGRESVTENLWHLWVEKQCYQQYPCPSQCNNNLLVLLKSVVVDCCSCAVSCHIHCDAKATDWNGIDFVYWVWSVLFSFSILTEGKKNPLPFKYFCRVWHWPPSLSPWVLITKYRVWCFSVFCCCSEIALCCLSVKVTKDLYRSVHGKYIFTDAVVLYSLQAGRKKDPSIWVFALCSLQVRKYVGTIHRSSSEHVEYSKLAGHWFHYTWGLTMTYSL